MERFRCYLDGGCPPGATRVYPGARESATELDSRPFTMPGGLVFAWQSPTWGGGIAFYEPEAGDGVLARAYLLTARQFADVLEQEMWRAPGTDLDLSEVLRAGRHTIGPGRYETLHLAGELEGRPVLTFSAADVEELGIHPPADAYVVTMARGLRDTHQLSTHRVVDYLLACRGIGRSRHALDALVTDALT